MSRDRKSIQSLPLAYKENSSALTGLRSWWITSRPEFAAAISIIVVGIPALLAIYEQQLEGRLVLQIGAGLIIWWLAIFAATSLNCLGDYEIDRLDINGKARFSQSIDRAGRTFIWKINLIEIALNTILIVGLSLWLDRFQLLVIWTIGLFFAISYSFEPLKLKRRSWLNPLAIVLGAFMSPMVFMSYLFSGELTQNAASIIILFSLQATSISLGDELSDYEVDRQQDINTPCVYYGRFRIASLAALIFSIASVVLTLQIIGLFMPKDVWHWGIVLIMIAMFILVSLNFWILTFESYTFEKKAVTDDNAQRLITLKRHVRTPVWILLSGLGIFIPILSIVIFPA